MPHIHDDGLRIRFTTGYGQYSYSGFRRVPPAGGCGGVFGCAPVSSNIEFDAVTQYGEVLIGYLKRFGELTAKAFIGAVYSNHSIGPKDPDNEVQDDAWGVKGGLELWQNLGPSAWASFDGSYTTAHDAYAVRFRYGYRVLPTLSLGPEAGVNGHLKTHSDGDLVYTRGRAGGFARYEYAGGELSASGGVSADIDNDVTPYATINWMSRF